LIYFSVEGSVGAGLASGAADDWALGVAKIPFTYTVELRDKGHYSFFLPPDQIRPSGEEMMAGLAASAMEIVKICNQQQQAASLLRRRFVMVQRIMRREARRRQTVQKWAKTEKFC
jgi:hypothetical protein